MAQRLVTSISKTVRLVGFASSAVFGICVKWINDGETSRRSQAIGCPHITKKKGWSRLSRLVKQNRLKTVGQLTAE
ncbi:HTH_Tnp_Tc3_2 domain-containing protein [Trichonephila clavipes]|nr:HTH_Tnp_Tc3_2 domain-containing protein [Trichonephila clavipes]